MAALRVHGEAQSPADPCAAWSTHRTSPTGHRNTAARISGGCRRIHEVAYAPLHARRCRAGNKTVRRNLPYPKGDRFTLSI